MPLYQALFIALMVIYIESTKIAAGPSVGAPIFCSDTVAAALRPAALWSEEKPRARGAVTSGVELMGCENWISIYRDFLAQT
jgi:hypothetical protein